jgi:hypothetical protein
MKVIKSEENLLELDNGMQIYGDYEPSCCEHNYLDFEQLPVGTEFKNMTVAEFARAIKLKQDGFIIKDKLGTPKWVQARSIQNGYYGSLIDVYLEYAGKKRKLGELDGEVSE